MGNFEGLRRRQTTQSTFTVPTDKMFAGDFSEILPGTVIYDPTTGQPFPGNVIPASRIDPISKNLLTYYHSSTLPGLTNNYTQDNSQPFDRKGYVVRADFNESSSSQWMGRYNWGDDKQSTQGIGLAGSKTVTNYKQWGGSNTRTLSSTLVNDARFGYTKFFNSIGTLSAFTNDVVGDLKIPNLKSGDPVTWGIPSVAFTGFNGIGDITDGPFAVDNNTLQFVDKLTWMKGRHTIGMGAEYDRQHFNEVGNQFSRGSFEFSAFRTRNPANNTGGYAFAEFLLGQPFRTSVALAIAEGKFVRNVFHAFVDDNWKVTNKLTLLAGLRYELTPPFTNTLGTYFTVHIPTIDYSLNQPQSNYPTLVRQGDNCTDPYAGLSLRWTVTPVGCAKDFGLNNNLRETKYKNFAPRLGATYALGRQDGHPRRRGALLHGRHRQRRVLRHGPYHRRPRRHASIGNERSSPGPMRRPAGEPPRCHRRCRGRRPTATRRRAPGSIWSTWSGSLPRTGRWSWATSDRRAATSMGSRPSTRPVRARSNSISSRVPYPTFGVISYVTDQNKGHYNAFSVKATRRYGDGVSLNTSYTLAKSIDNSSGTRTQGFDTLFPQDSRCMECETGPSSFDVRHRWVLGAVYELPFGKGKRGEHRQRRPGRHCRRVAVEHEHHDPERRSADALRRQGSIGHQRPGERPSELLGRGQRLCRRPLADALVRPRVVRLVSRGPIRDRRAQFDDHAASAADRRVAGEELSGCRMATAFRPGSKPSTCSTIRCGAHPTETSWRARHSRARRRTRRIRASASSPRRPSRCARFSSG